MNQILSKTITTIITAMKTGFCRFFYEGKRKTAATGTGNQCCILLRKYSIPKAQGNAELIT